MSDEIDAIKKSIKEESSKAGNKEVLDEANQEQDQVDSEDGRSDKLLSKFIPNFSPRLEIDKKLISGEVNKDHAVIRYYSEIQILIGLLILGVGVLALIVELMFIFLAIAGLVLVATGFELEEIYVTNKRIMIRRIGLVERIVRIPADEEHLINHIVSFNIGRAPTHKVFMSLAAISLISGLTVTISSYIGFIVILCTLLFFILGLRLGKRVVTLNLAGGHFIILGLRKGVPTHLIESIMTSAFEQ